MKLKKTPGNPFKQVVWFDQTLFSQARRLHGLTLRHREPGIIYLANAEETLFVIATKEWLGGPNRILVECLPAPDVPLPFAGWSLQGRILRVPTMQKLPLSPASDAAAQPLELSAIHDYPGHMHTIIGRLRIKLADEPVGELTERLTNLEKALGQRLTEALEPAILDLVGHGGGICPRYDLALSGVLLTARALSLGKRLRLPWQPWFSMEIRRFLHRSNLFGRNLLQFALDGRVTELQARFFAAMSRDYEGADDIAAQALLSADPWSGLPFLLGVLTVLNIVRPSFFGPSLPGSAPSSLGKKIAHEKN